MAIIPGFEVSGGTLAGGARWPNLAIRHGIPIMCRLQAIGYPQRQARLAGRLLQQPGRSPLASVVRRSGFSPLQGPALRARPVTVPVHGRDDLLPRREHIAAFDLELQKPLIGIEFGIQNDLPP